MLQVIKSISRNSLLEFCLAGLVSLPAVFINLHYTHDWGGDFAMYIHQAMEIVDGFDAHPERYIFNPDFVELGPAHGPVGFPLLLAPLYAVFGMDIEVFLFFISFCLLPLGIACFYLFRHFASLPVSLVMVFMILYNPWTLEFKIQVLSDIPFTLFFVLAILGHLKRWPLAFTITCAALAISIRSIGFVLILGWLMELLIALLSKRAETNGRSSAKNLGMLCVATSVIVFLMTLLIPTGQAGSGFHTDLILSGLGEFQIWDRLALYTNIMKAFFDETHPTLGIVARIVKHVFIVILAIGLIPLFKHKFLFTLFVSYIAVLIVYPFANSGFRFLFPLLPVILVTAYQARHVIPQRIGLPKWWLAAAGLIVLCLIYYKGWLVIDYLKDPQKGPEEPGSIAMIHWLKQNISEDDVVLFGKPRVLAHYAEVQSTCNAHDIDQNAFEQFLQNFQVSHVLLNDDLPNPAATAWSKKDSANTFLWRFRKFELHQVN